MFFLYKVFAQVLVGFRYGRDDLDLLGVNFRRDLVDVCSFLILLFTHAANDNAGTCPSIPST